MSINRDKLGGGGRVVLSNSKLIINLWVGGLTAEGWEIVGPTEGSRSKTQVSGVGLGHGVLILHVDFKKSLSRRLI